MRPSRRLSISSLLGLGLSLQTYVTALPAGPTSSPPRISISGRAPAVGTAAIDRDFPDPCIIQDADGTWYAFATASGGRQVQAARAGNPSGPWTYIDQDLLPDPGPWTTGDHTWAPNVQRIADGKYVLYYAGQVARNSAHHCVGVATAQTVLGPYRPAERPLVCDLASGGAIDPNGFWDEATGRRYVAYKVDGNSVGHGGDCNNAVAPMAATPIMLQEVSARDGATPIGRAVQILDRDGAADGPLVEAPSLAYVPSGGGKDDDDGGPGYYVLFYSNHCWSTPQYAVNYATASSIQGPYKRSGQALMKSGDFGLMAPGGANSVDGTGKLVFHADCPQGRCMFQADYTTKAGKIAIP